MHISNLSCDILSIIATLVDGKDVFRLLESGNRQLEAKLRASAKSLNVASMPFVAFPFSAFQLPHLASLSVFTPETYYVVPLKLQHRLPLPTEPTKSLTRLRLAFAQSFSVLSLDGDTPLLQRRFPNLTALKLELCPREITREHLTALPRSLLRLQLKSSHSATFARRTPLSYLDLALLPPDLVSINMGCLAITADPSTRRFDKIPWPVGLRKLAMNSFENPYILYNLPPNIEKLYIDVQDGGAQGTFPTSLLPRSLIHCTINGMYGKGFYIVSDNIFPPNLKTFNTNFRFTDEREVLCLPSSLTDCRQLSTLANLLRFDLVPNTRAMLGFSPKVPDYVMMNQLPKNLTSISSSESDPDVIPWKSLPQTLKFIGLRIATAEQAALIPRSLTRISIPQTSPYTLTPAILSNLPRGITDFSFNMDHLEGVDCFEHFPPLISTFDVSLEQGCKPALCMATTLMSYLKPLEKITSLSFSISGIECVWRDWIADLRNHLPNVASLIVSIDDPVGEELKKPGQYLKHLPPSLTELYVTLTPHAGDELDPLLLASLPPKLNTLLLMNPYIRHQPVTIPLTDAHFAKLPNSLTCLSVDPITGLTDHFFDLIPPYISDLQVPPYLSNEAQVKYFSRDDIWEGYSLYLNRLPPPT